MTFPYVQMKICLQWKLRFFEERAIVQNKFCDFFKTSYFYFYLNWNGLKLEILYGFEKS